MYKTAHSPTYLVKNPYSYCFRIKVPEDLRATLSRKELRYSLKTGNLPEAKTKARLLAGEIQLIYKRLRKGLFIGMNLSDFQIYEMIKKYLQGLIQEYDQPAKYNKYVDDKDYHSYLTDGDAINGTLMILDDIKAEYNVKLHSGDYSQVEPEADRLLAEEGLGSNIEKDSPAYWKLCSGILRAKIKGFEHQQKRLSGQLSDGFENVLEEYLQGSDQLQRVGNGGGLRKSPNVKKSKGPKLSDVIPLFTDEAKVNWEPKTESEVIASLNLFIEVVGDVLIQSINRAKVAEYKAVLKKLPPNKNKVKKYRGKTIAELMEMDIKKTLSTVRINKNIERAPTMRALLSAHQTRVKELVESFPKSQEIEL